MEEIEDKNKYTTVIENITPENEQDEKKESEMQEKTPEELLLEQQKAYYISLLKKSGIVAAFIAGILSFLVCFSLLARNSWTKKLKLQVNTVLMENTNFIATDWIKIKTSMTVSASLYKAVSPSKNITDGWYCAIIRVSTIYGPVPCVYLYNSTDVEAEFVGFCQINGTISDRIKESAMNSQIEYWKNKVPRLVNCVFPEKNKKNQKGNSNEKK